MAKGIIIEEGILRQLYEVERKSVKEMSQILGIEVTTVRRKLHRAGIPVRSMAEEKRKYKINQSYFEVIDTKEKAYILGFLCADGYLATTRNTPDNPDCFGFGIHERDADFLSFFKEEIGSEHKIRNIGKECKELRITNIKMTKDLVKLGLTTKKTLTIDIGEIAKRAKLEGALLSSFILGYFDGDGGIYKCLGANKKTYQYSMSITGTRETCDFLYDYFNQIGFMTKRHKNRETNNYTYVISGRNLVCQCLDKLYDDKPKFTLERKYLKYLEAKSPAT